MAEKEMKFCKYHAFKEARWVNKKDGVWLCGECRWHLVRTLPEKERKELVAVKKQKRFYGIKIDKELLKELQEYAEGRDTSAAMVIQRWCGERLELERS